MIDSIMLRLSVLLLCNSTHLKKEKLRSLGGNYWLSPSVITAIADALKMIPDYLELAALAQIIGAKDFYLLNEISNFICKTRAIQKAFVNKNSRKISN
jgi:hypothetical protein